MTRDEFIQRATIAVLPAFVGHYHALRGGKNYESIPQDMGGGIPESISENAVKLAKKAAEQLYQNNEELDGSVTKDVGRKSLPREKRRRKYNPRAPYVRLSNIAARCKRDLGRDVTTGEIADVCESVGIKIKTFNGRTEFITAVEARDVYKIEKECL